MSHNNLKKKNLIVGAGFSGAVMAQKLADTLNEDVLVIDKAPNLAGACYDYDKNNIKIHKFGSHIFHTNYEYIWKYLNKFSKFNTYMHKNGALIDGISVTLPFNLNTINKIFPKIFASKLEYKLMNKYQYSAKIPIIDFKRKVFWDKDFDFLANYIYQNTFFNQAQKQWNSRSFEIEPDCVSKISVFISKDDRYYQDKFQGVPKDGYTKLIENILNHKNIKILTSTDYKDINIGSFDRIFYTGPIDEFFDYKYGVLEYRSAYFDFIDIDKEFYQLYGVMNYPNNYDFVKIHEFKHYMDKKTDNTIIAKEYVKDFILGENERFYPILNEKNIKIYKKYKNEAKKLDNIYFLGRLGDFKNYEIDKAIKRAFELFDAIKFREYSNADVDFRANDRIKANSALTGF